ncbi:MAG: GspMb/PilO family protein [Candidatus Omnitrophota bacterium]|nr:GspMb/PilO family protein [Candidatus Omnitrophota bacterium]
MLKITPSQKKIIILAASVVLLFLFIWLFIYIPTKRAASDLKVRLASVEKQIQEITAITGQALPPQESLKLFEEKFQKIDVKFPIEEEESLKMLSGLAEDSNVEIISIKPQARTVLLDEDNQKIEIEGRTCQKIFVTLEMRCSYRDLIKYLDSLEDSLPAYISIERLSINKEAAGAAKLYITLEFNLFFIF